MIKQIIIEKLFGRFTYDFKTCDDGVTIITGPNGYGKSTILHVIYALSKAKIGFFDRLDFSSITAVFENDKSVKIEKNDSVLTIDGCRLDFSDKTNDLISYFVRSSSRIVQLSKNVFLDRKTGVRCGPHELLELFPPEMKDSIISESFTSKVGKVIKNISKWSGEVRLISEQRLIKTKQRDEEQVIEVIKELPDKLKSEINSVYSEYSKVANSLDGSYPKRLFSADDGINDETEYLERLEEAKQKFEKLKTYDLVDMAPIEDTKFESKFAEALKIYFDDFSQKFVVFEKLIKKLDMFTKIINDRLSFKRIQISRQNGFEIVDTDDAGRKLELSQLSSGEKQEIVLFYDLIFDTKSELLLLIDEPEISLHISWQKKFMDDLLKVAKENMLKVIVATHSPQIINNHWDIQIDLGELYGS